MIGRDLRIGLARESPLPSSRSCGGIHVQQVDLDARIGHVRGNLGAHRSGADDDGSAKGDGHSRVIIPPKCRNAGNAGNAGIGEAGA
jgi:hypothetical protein